MTGFDAFYLPGLDTTSVAEWRYLEQGSTRLRWPVLAPTQLELVCRHVRSQREGVLVETAVAELVTAIDAAARRLSENLDAHATLLADVTGYSIPVVTETLDHMFADWRASNLELTLASELGDARVLDHPVPDARIESKQIAAYGFPFAFHIFSGNVPGVAVTSIIRSLLVKSATLGKTASGEPVLPILFARALQEVAPKLAQCLAITYWPGGTTSLEDVALRNADVVVVYGGEAAVQAIAPRVINGARLIAHGPRVSFGMIGPLAQMETVSLEVAHSVAAYDQQGCVSPHVVYVVGSAQTAREYARAISEKLEALDATHPRGRVSASDAVAIRNVRAAAEFGGFDSDDAELFGAEPAGYAVIYERDPTFKPSCLNRVLYVKPLPAPSSVSVLLPPRRLLQSVAMAGFEDAEKAELIRLLGLSGVSRVTTFAQLAWPPMHWHHDGSPPLGELVVWQDVES